MTDTIQTDQTEKLACGVCYRYFPPQDLTVASKERFNWEASVVACPECLTELKLEMRDRSNSADLVLGLVWAVLGAFVTGLLISLVIWTQRNNASYSFWQWIGSYFAFIPGFIIGRLVRYGVGKRHSLEQQLIAVFFTLLTAMVTSYIGWIADNNNFYSTIIGEESPLVLYSLPQFLNNRFFPAVANFGDVANLVPRLGIDVGIIFGLLVAFFSSEGNRIFTRRYR